MKSRFVYLLLFLALQSPQQIDASFWDSIPGISQIKSLVQVISGDVEGARKTQENFLDTAPVVSQIKSAVQAGQGDSEGAKKTQIAFAENLGEFVDSVPIVGQIKGGIHIAVGDRDRGLEIIKGATSSTGALLGGILGGPAGAIFGGGLVDGAYTAIESAVEKKYTPFGVFDYFSNIQKKSAGEHFDQWLGFGLDIAGGKKVSDKGSKGTGKSASSNTITGSIDHMVDAGLDEYHSRFESGFGSGRPPGRLADVFDSQTFHENIEYRNRLENERGLENARTFLEGQGLPRLYSERLNRGDFLRVNTNGLTHNCHMCAACGLRGWTTERYGQVTGAPVLVGAAPDIPAVFKTFDTAGFKDINIHPNNQIGYTLSELHNFLDSSPHTNEGYRFALAYKHQDGNGHVITARVWWDENGNRRYLSTDFQQEPFNAKRFNTEIPTDKPYFWIIHPGSVVLDDGSGNIVSFSNFMTSQGLVTVLPVNEDQAFATSQSSKCNLKRVIAYVPEWSKVPFTLTQSLHLTNVIFAFAEMGPDGSVVIPDRRNAYQRLEEVKSARRSQQSRGFALSLSFAIGGWENSRYYSKVIGDGGLRATFIDNIVSIIQAHSFDGVDIDWEYPITGGAVDGVQADKQNYVEFLRALRSKLGAGKLISIASAAGSDAGKGFSLKEISQYVDWIGVMTYDFNGAWDSRWGEYVGPNAPLLHGAPPKYSGKLNSDWALKRHSCQTGNPNKIVMGIPFYGRYWTVTVDGPDPGGYPLFRKAIRQGDGTIGGEIIYRELISTWLVSGQFEKKYDDRTKTPYLISTDAARKVVTYDDADSIGLKVEYAIKNNLAGVMIWAVDQDDDQLTLLNAVSSRICRATGNSVTYKCNPLGDEIRWWTLAESEENAGKCGKEAPLYKGYYARCDPEDSGYSCCSKFGYCGSGSDFCDCDGCDDYGKNPDKLLAEPVRP